VRLVYAGVLRIDLPSYEEAYVSLAEREEIGELMQVDASRWPWAMVFPGRECQHDVAVFRRGALAAHVGVVIEPGRMLHAEQGRESCIVSYADGPWRHRLVGVYRHADLR
jgi:hypothetical protein